MATGSPDWQRYPARVGSNLLPSDTVDAAETGTVYGPYAVTNWGGISLSAVPSSGGGVITVTWWEEKAMTSQVKQDTWVVISSTQLMVTMPTWSEWFSIEYTAFVAGGWTVTTSVRGLASAGPGIVFPFTGGNITEPGITLTPGQVVYYPSPNIRSGLAYVSFYPYDTLTKLLVSVMSYSTSGNPSDVLIDWTGPAGISNWLIAVPPTSLAFRVKNNDSSANHTFDLHVAFD